MIHRLPTKEVKVGTLTMGGSHPIWVQSMTNTDTLDKEATLQQVLELERAGCDIVRLTVPTKEAAKTFCYLKEKGVKVPLVADIHFDWRIAIEAVKAGADKIRINPGNIGDHDRVIAVTRACREAGVPIRIGVNGGSLEKHILGTYGAPTPQALVESALYHVDLLESVDFRDIVISVKTSSVPHMIEANRLLREKTAYPLHLGVTEAGGREMGTVKSAIGIGTLLSQGIGDTVRVSLTDHPVREVEAARNILSCLGLSQKPQMNIVSCPTCGRTKIDLIHLLHRFEEAVDKENLRHIPVKVAIMGCIVNGPGEARDADIGIAGGEGNALLFRKGEIVGKYPEGEIISRLIEEIKEMKHD